MFSLTTIARLAERALGPQRERFRDAAAANDVDAIEGMVADYGGRVPGGLLQVVGTDGRIITARSADRVPESTFAIPI